MKKLLVEKLRYGNFESRSKSSRISSSCDKIMVNPTINAESKMKR